MTTLFDYEEPAVEEPCEPLLPILVEWCDGHIAIWEGDVLIGTQEGTDGIAAFIARDYRELGHEVKVWGNPDFTVPVQRRDQPMTQAELAAYWGGAA